MNSECVHCIFMVSVLAVMGCANASAVKPAQAARSSETHSREPSSEAADTSAHSCSAGPDGAPASADEPHVDDDLSGSFDPAAPPSVPVYDSNAKATRKPETSRAAGCDTSKDPLCEGESRAPAGP